MKRNNLLFLLLAFAFALGMAACFDDDSKLGSDFIPDIELGELRDTAMVSYAGNILSLAPEIDTPYADSELSYAWYIYDAGNATTTDGGELDGFRTEKIGDQRTLDYEVNLPSGTYGIVLEVTASQYNYSRRTSMTLSVSTEFSRGFYILKETADGRSDLDLATESGLNEDLMTNILGAPLEGAPLNLSMAYAQCYIDEETQEMEYSKILNVFTEEDYRAFRTEDMQQVLDRNSIFFDDSHEGETLYGLYHGFMSLFLFTEAGIYGGTPGGELFPGYEQVSSGKFGFPTGTGASKYAQQLGQYTGIAFWNETERMLFWGDYYGTSVLALNYELPSGMDASTAECLGSGTNAVGGGTIVWFLLRDASNRRCLLLLENGSNRVTDVVAIDDSTPRFAQAGIVAGNALSASIIYFVSDNAVWAYSLSSGSEYSVPLPGGVEGTINYITNSFLNLDGWSGGSGENFDAFVVATETASGGYNLYFFNDLSGGVPQSAVVPYRGTGSVRSVRYAPSLQPSFGMTGGLKCPWTD